MKTHGLGVKIFGILALVALLLSAMAPALYVIVPDLFPPQVSQELPNEPIE